MQTSTRVTMVFWAVQSDYIFIQNQIITKNMVILFVSIHLLFALDDSTT